MGEQNRTDTYKKREKNRGGDTSTHHHARGRNIETSPANNSDDLSIGFKRIEGPQQSSTKYTKAQFYANEQGKKTQRHAQS